MRVVCVCVLCMRVRVCFVHACVCVFCAWVCVLRHREPSKRPVFSHVRNEFSLPDSTLLHWMEEDMGDSPEALQLMGSMQIAKNMFKDLQNAYV